MNFVELVLMGSLVVFHPSTDECKKVKNPKPVNTWMSVMLAETSTVKTLRGQIVDTNEKPISGALIEVIRISENSGEYEGKVIYVCKTQDGSFHFKKLKNGQYELRVSVEGHDLTSVRITVAKTSQSNKEILIMMRVSS